MALFEAAAKQGHFPSAAYCGQMLLQGQGVGSDWTEALGWYRQAAFSMGVRDENLPEESGPISFQLLQISQLMMVCGQQALAYPLLKELTQNKDYPTAFLLLAALYRQGIPGELAPDPQLAKECFSRWQNAVEPGDALGFGSYPQHLEPYRYQQGRCFELTPWTVLEKRPDRVLLLCRLSLEYTAEGRLSFPLFSEAEQGLILAGPFPLSKQQFQTYLAEQKLDEAAAFASLYARMVKAQRVGIAYERTENGVQFSTGNRRYTEEERREWEEVTGLVEKLSTRTTAMLLSDGAAFGYKLLNFCSSDELTFRPAVWVGLPED